MTTEKVIATPFNTISILGLYLFILPKLSYILSLCTSITMSCYWRVANNYALWFKWAGGTFAMYSLLCQHTSVGGQSRKLSQFTAIADSQLSHFHTAWEEKPSKVKKWLEHHKHAQEILLFVVMLGTCMLIGDGILTPAISGEKILLLISSSKKSSFLLSLRSCISWYSMFMQ